MKRHIIIVIVCLLLVLVSCGTRNTEVTEDSITATEDLQIQVNDLNSKLVAFTATIDKMQSQIKTTKPPTTSAATKQMQGDIEELTDTLAALTAEIESIQTQITALQDTTTQIASLQTQVTALQEGLRAASTSIGATSTTVNGLGIVFVNNTIDLPATGPVTANSAQFAIKIVNTTGKVVNNIDVTGVIICAPFFAGLAAGYPQIADANSLCSYALSGNGSNMLRFEAYSGGKTALSIPVGGSITLRPKITVLAAKDCTLPAMNFTISVNIITYDLAEPAVR